MNITNVFFKMGLRDYRIIEFYLSLIPNFTSLFINSSSSSVLNLILLRKTIHFTSFVFVTVYLFACFVFVCQLKNSVKSDLCLDQGPDNDNMPILYLCHGMTPQVRAPLPSLLLMVRFNTSPLYCISRSFLSCNAIKV